MNRPDSSLWRELILNLREQRRHIHTLIRLSQEQTRALAEAEAEHLSEISRQQAECLDEIDMLEGHRKEIVDQIARSMGLHADPPSLSDCAQIAPEHVARTLKWLQRELLQDVRRLQTLNDRNRALVHQAAETVNTWLALVVNATHNQASYHPQTGTGVAVVVNTEV